MTIVDRDDGSMTMFAVKGVRIIVFTRPIFVA